MRKVRTIGYPVGTVLVQDSVHTSRCLVANQGSIKIFGEIII